MSRCSICKHAQALEINSCLEARLKLAEIAKQFQVSQYAVSRHKNRCLVTPVLAGELSSSSAELAKWLSRADEQYLTASANGDVTRAVAALTAAFRGLAASEKQREREREQAAKNDVLANGEHRLTIENLDALVETYLQTLEKKPQ